ncbi:PKD domain-containing protein, partial [Candidatus Acetothermia bacterium]|nr:PKD domain-containing protein [Candidatus Acetothermia bacterium]
MPQSGPGPMVITGTDPSSGSPGTVVTVHCHFCQQGSTLKAGSEITFDGTAVNTTFLSDTQPQFIVPADASCGPHKVQAIIPAFFTHLKEMSNVVTFTVTTPCSGGSGPGPNPGNQPPHANFTFTPANTAVGQMVQFTDQSSDPDGVSDIVSWNWDLGDGMTSTTQNHQHTYHSAATFTVRLIVTDHAGQTGTAIKSVTVTATPSSGSSLKSFDKNNNNKLDDTEFFAAVDAWIAGQISDIIFFKLVDLWISQGPITAASLRQLPPLSLDGVTLALS